MKKIILVLFVCAAVVCGYLYLMRRGVSVKNNENPSAVVYQTIEVESPKSGEEIQSPFHVMGRARGIWFFEGSFPVMLVDWDGRIIAQGSAAAQGEWMTEEFVPFEAVLEFEKPDLYPERGALILKKDNPSGLPENDAAVEIPIQYE